MKIELHEYSGCFSFDMVAETVADASLLARLKMNGKKEVRGIYASAYDDGTFTGTINIGKARQSRGYLK